MTALQTLLTLLFLSYPHYRRVPAMIPFALPVLALWASFPCPGADFRTGLLFPVLLGIVINDIRFCEIPSLCMVLFLFLTLSGCRMLYWKASAVILFVLFPFALAGKIGYADVRLIAYMTLKAGPRILYVLLSASLTCLITALLIRKDKVPFGPFLVLGWLLCGI